MSMPMSMPMPMARFRNGLLIAVILININPLFQSFNSAFLKNITWKFGILWKQVNQY